MQYIVLFEDTPGTEHLRQTNMAAHLAFLEAHSSELLAAGPLFAPDGQGAGGLWLVEAATPEAVQVLIEDDPFWPTGLRQSVTIRAWRHVFRQGQRLI